MFHIGIRIGQLIIGYWYRPIRKSNLLVIIGIGWYYEKKAYRSYTSNTNVLTPEYELIFIFVCIVNASNLNSRNIFAPEISYW